MNNTKKLPLVFLTLLSLPLLTACHSAPALPAACQLQPESGRCRASIMRFWYDERVGACKAFIWGGCNGVAPFETLEACRSQCMTGTTGQLDDTSMEQPAAEPARPDGSAPPIPTTP